MIKASYCHNADYTPEVPGFSRSELVVDLADCEYRKVTRRRTPPVVDPITASYCGIMLQAV